MLQRIGVSIRQNPGRVALALAVLLGLANVFLMSPVFLNRAAAGQLESEVVALTDSLAQLRQVEQDGLRGLEEEASAAEGELASLEASFPNLGERFDIYRQGFALAEANQVEILAMDTGGSSTEETPVGFFEVSSYRIDAVGSQTDCIQLLGALERAGLAALALNEVTLDMEDQSCAFEVILASLGELTEGISTDG